MYEAEPTPDLRGVLDKSGRGFPQGLLEQPESERLAYFKSFTVAHPILKEADSALKQALREPAGGSLVFVYGPTGVGKTTLRLRVEKHLKEVMLPALKEDPSLVPVVSIVAVAPDSSQFSWRDYYKRALIALEEPLIDRKIIYRVHGVSRNSSGELMVDPRVLGLELRHALETALYYRRPTAFFIDEAQHLARLSSGRKLQDQLDSIKSLAGITSTLHVLIGTYELLNFLNLSAQLSRRSIDIHFPRYRADRESDLRAFQNVIFTFQRHLPLAEEPDLLKHWEYCYERSIGCVGVLKDWFTRALAAALEEGATALTLKHLQQRAMSLDQCSRMAREAIEGEKDLTERKESREQLRQLLGLVPATPADNSTSERSVNRTGQPRKAHPVGQRTPHRDKVGTANPW
jgi:AAA domain